MVVYSQVLHFFQDQYTYNSLNVLYEYLSDSAISPLEREFVQIEDPYCSNVGITQYHHA